MEVNAFTKPIKSEQMVALMPLPRVKPITKKTGKATNYSSYERLRKEFAF